MPQHIQVKTILNKTKRRDPWFLDDYAINPYSGCSFHCLNCHIRGSKYGEHMEQETSVKGNVAELLDKQLELRAKKNQQGIIVLSSATDPYLHFEKEERLTRRILELMLKYRFPLHVITMSDLVVRDLDLLKEIGKDAIIPTDLRDRLQNKAFVSFSFSTINDNIASIFEPGATAPTSGIKAMKEVLKNGIHCGVNLMPTLPYIADTAEHLKEMFSLFSQLRVHYIFPATITLFGEGASNSKSLVMKAVGKHYPQLLEKYQIFFRAAAHKCGHTIRWHFLKNQSH